MCLLYLLLFWINKQDFWFKPCLKESADMKKKHEFLVWDTRKSNICTLVSLPSLFVALISKSSVIYSINTSDPTHGSHVSCGPQLLCVLALLSPRLLIPVPPAAFMWGEVCCKFLQRVGQSGASCSWNISLILLMFNKAMNHLTLESLQRLTVDSVPK